MSETVKQRPLSAVIRSALRRGMSRVLSGFGGLLRAVSAALIGVLISGLAHAAEPGDVDFTDMSLEELMNVEITSVSKKPQRLSDAAAAIFVISQEDIRRSGATNIPEALRMAPGVQVAHIDANKWAITVRGFNSQFANKLLVLLDGRSLYTPLFGGVFWDVQDTLMEDIERIEVIRGPGATLWGANAVNGVINIITKNARDTQGFYVEAGGGTQERAFGGGRYGGKVGDNAYYRAYAKYFKRDAFKFSTGRTAFDDWDQGRAGFRADIDVSDTDTLMLEGDVYKGEDGQTLTQPTLVPPFSTTFSQNSKVSGASGLGHWNRTLSEDSDLSLQTYFDHTKREEPMGTEIRNTFDIDFQHRFVPLVDHDLVWGLGYRGSFDDIDSGFPTEFDPEDHGSQLVNAFVQDEIAFLDDELKLTLGTKIEWNNHTGIEIQPSGRLLWAPDPHHSVWGAISRAVRIPTRAETDVIGTTSVVPPGIPVVIRGEGDLDSEDLLAFEAGYRVEPMQGLSLDVAGFYNRYTDIISGDQRLTFAGGALNTQFVNNTDAETYGGEVSLRWQPFSWWRLQGAYSHITIDTDVNHGNSIGKGQSPHNTVYARSSFDVTDTVDFDLTLRYVDDIPTIGVSDYLTMDARIAWRPLDGVEFSIVGQNLLEARHSEFTSEDAWQTVPTEVPRGVYGKVTVSF